MSPNASDQYQTQRIMTASPAMLVFMLFDKAVGSLKEAIRAIEAGEIEARWRANKRAMDIIEHLRMTLDIDAGGEIARNLDGLYGLLLRELPRVDLKNDPRPAEKAIGLLEPLRASWQEIANKGEDAAREAAQAAGRSVPARTGGPASYGAASNQSPEVKSGKGDPSPPRGITISA